MATYLSTSTTPLGVMVETSPPEPGPSEPRPQLLALNPDVGYTTSTEADGW